MIDEHTNKLLLRNNDEFSWMPLRPSLSQDAVARVLESWRGTQYKHHERAKSMFCDCTNFVAGALDELFRTDTPTTIPPLPADTAINDPESAKKTVFAFRRSWEGSDPVTDGSLEPGDVVVMRANLRDRGMAPNWGHIGLIGAEPFQLFHATPGFGVHSVPIGMGFDRQILAVWRARRKDLWY